VSKAGVNALVRMLAAETAGANVLVNAACPGWVRNDMGGPNATRTVPEGADTAVWLATLEDSGPTGGVFRDRAPIAFLRARDAPARLPALAPVARAAHALGPRVVPALRGLPHPPGRGDRRGHRHAGGPARVPVHARRAGHPARGLPGDPARAGGPAARAAA